MTTNPFITLVLSLLVLSGRAAAASDANDSNALSTVQDYLRYAALHNAGLKSSFERWKAAVEQIPQAQALPDPKFTYGYFIEEVETRVGPQRQRVGISQVFPWFGKIDARTDAAAAAAEAAKQRYEAAKLDLFYRVKQVFHEYVYLAEAIRYTRENLELVKHFEEVARIKYEAAAAGHPDVIRAQVELARLDDAVRTIEALREPIVARANATLNRPSTSQLPWPQRQQFKLARFHSQVLTEMLVQKNPELAGLENRIQRARSRIRLADKQFYPDIGVGVDWIQTDHALAPNVRDSGKDPVMLMLTLNLPVWRDSYRAAREQARAELRQVQQARIETENTLLAHTAESLYDYDDTIRKIELYGDALIPKARELVQASETAYTAGTIDFLSLIDAQRMLLQYEVAHERALADNRQKLAELEMLTGVQVE
jgi:outer membrane protein TolC